MTSFGGKVRGIARALAGIAILTIGAVTTLAADPVGPPIGNNRFRSTISDASDTDSFVGRFFAGDIVNVSVVADRVQGSKFPTLKPVLVLLDPNGLVRFAGIVPSPDGFAQTLKNFVIDTPGIWAARVSGANGTTGSFTAAFRVKSSPKQVFKRLRLGDDLPFSRTHEFSGFDGAKLNVVLTYTKQSNDVEIRALTDPSGNDVQAPDPTTEDESDTRDAVLGAVQKKQRVELKNVVLGKGSGTYRMRVRIPTAAATYNLSISLAGPPKPVDKSRSIRKLSPNEPRLDPREVPAAGEVGDTVQFTGVNFSASPPPTVVFGTVKSKKVTTSDGGTKVDVLIPPKPAGGPSVVAIYLSNPDGQADGQDRYFAYIPPPVVSDLLDATTGLHIDKSSAAGGRAVRLIGDNFELGQTVTIGPVVVSGVVIKTSKELNFLMPAVPPGDHSITVADAFLRSDTSDFTIFFKTPPSFAKAPYTPGAIKVQQATPVTIKGSNFQDVDQLVFNGVNTASVFVDDHTRTFTIPPLGVGAYPVVLVDSIGTVVKGPDLYVKPPATINSVSVIGGDVTQSILIPLAGGSTIQVDGTDFAPDDVVTVGGNTVTTLLLTTTTRKQFLAPASSTIGFAGITITDGAGQSGSIADAVKYANLQNTTASRVPAKSAVDDLSAIAAVAADLDRDNLADDLVISSPFGNSPGSRTRLTRVLLGNGSALVDATNTSIPAAGSDGWDARCIAVGDIDKTSPIGNDIVIGGSVTLYGTNDKQIRLFRQSTVTAGVFTNDTANAPPLRTMTSYSAYYLMPKTYYGGYYTVYGAVQQQGTPQGIAIGDIDNDTVADIVMGTDHFQSRFTYYDPTQLYSYYGQIRLRKLIVVNQSNYIPAVRVYQNKIPSGLKTIDVSVAKLPSAGSSTNKATQPPALHCRDLALVDIDRSGTLDLIVAWDDPKTVTADGLNSKETGGTATSPTQVATRVLLYGPSGSSGKFTDVTSSWMPAGVNPEYWQAKRIAFGDLDKDGDQDMVLLLNKGLDAFTGTETHTKRALRILRNDGTKFSDQSNNALPAVDPVTADDFRGDALTINDVDGDGNLDILVSSATALKKPDSTNLQRFRIFFGKGQLKFGLHYGFSESMSVDTGEADRIVSVGDLGGAGVPVLILTGETAPATSPGGAFMRSQEWKK